MRLIDADALRAELTKWRDNDPYEKDRCVLERWIRKIGINVLIRLLMDFPTIEAEPVRHGRWGELDYDFNEDKYTRPCSNCGYKSMEYLKHYCPNCGAKMESGTVLSESEPLAGCVDDADLEHMTRFAMQQAINRK